MQGVVVPHLKTYIFSLKDNSSCCMKLSFLFNVVIRKFRVKNLKIVHIFTLLSHKTT